MIKKMFGCGGAFSLLALAACGGSVQSVGDGVSGAGGSNNAAAHAGSSSAQQHGGTSNGSGNAPSHVGGTSNGSGATSSGRGGAAWAPGTCDPPCSEGYGCYEVVDDPAGFCAPLCDTEEQGQTADADVSCANSVRGGAGTCVFSTSFGWPLPYVDITAGDALPAPSSNTVTGLCSNTCDPILHDCPAGYTCDATSTYKIDSRLVIYACLPSKQPHALGETCTSTGNGECGPGLTCTPGVDGGIFNATCTAFCDRRDTDACSGTEVCTENEVTMQDNDPNIGVCL